MSIRSILLIIMSAVLLVLLGPLRPNSHLQADESLPPPPLPRGCGFLTTPITTDEETCCVSGYVKFGDEVIGGAVVTIAAHGVEHNLATEIGTESQFPLYASFLSTLTPPVRVGDAVTVTARWQGYEATQHFTAVAGGQRVDIDLRAGSQSVAGELTLVDQLGGVGNALTKVGNHVYMGEGPRLVIVDVSDPANPFLLGRSPLLSGIVRDVAVAGDVAFVAAAEAGLHTFDISDPTNPRALSVYELNASAFGVTVALHANAEGSSSDATVYVGNGLDGMQIYTTTVQSVAETSNPARQTSALGDLSQVGQLDTPGFARKATIIGSTAYVADEYGGLRIADVSNPASPAEVGSLATQSARRIAVVGETAYVADSIGGLRVVDISNPFLPQEMGNLATDSSIESVVVLDNTAYAANTYGGLIRVDISNPAVPTLIDSTDLHGRDLVAEGNLVFASGSGGLFIIDSQGEEPFAQVGSYRTLGFVGGLTATTDALLVADWANGLWSINTNEAQGLQLHSYYGSKPGAWNVSLADQRAYLAANGIHVLDFTEPNDLQPALQEPFGEARDIAVAGQFGYVANGGAGLRVVALGDSLLTTVQTIPTNGFALRVNMSETESSSELSVVTPNGLDRFMLNNPAVPELIESWPLPGRTNDADQTGNLMGIAQGNGLFPASTDNPKGLRVVNLADGVKANQLGASGFFSTTSAALAVTTVDNRAYVAAGGLQVVDISAPLSPTLAASVAIPGSWNERADVAVVAGVAGDRVYVAADEAGLYAFDHTAEASQPHPVTNEPANWRILIYAAADNDLDPWLGYRADGMLSQLLGAGELAENAGGVEVAILYDGNRREDSVRYRLHADGSWIPEALGEVAMDDPETLADFIEWGMASLEAQRTYVIIADHANGVRGIALDETSDAEGKAFLTTSEIQIALQQATQAAGQTIDLLHFDGCSFGLLENTSLAAGVADYVIASPNTGWGTFEYEAYRAFASSTNEPQILAERIAQQYADEVARYGYPYTIAVHDMAKFEAVQSAVGALGDALASYILGEPAARIAEVERLRAQVQTYDSGDYRVDEFDRYVDLAHLLTLVETLGSAPITNAATTVRNHLDGFTIVARAKSGQLPAAQNNLLVNLDQASGLALYYPVSSSGDLFGQYSSHELFPSLTPNWGWTRFLREGIPALGGDPADESETLLAPIQPVGAGQPIPNSSGQVYLPWAVAP